MDTTSFRVLAAMLKAGLERKPKMSPVHHARRLAIETALLQRRYCNAFALWRTCARKACRRQRSCGGDAHLCLRSALARLPREAQLRARERILKSTPHNIGAPEREARQRLPRDFYAPDVP